jgi:hypothetical protein
MGCDIHMYPEYRRRGSDWWDGFTGRWHPGRDYALFGFLAGVRDDGPPVARPRGFPTDAGYRAKEDYILYVTPDEESANRWRIDGDDAIPRERAERWIGYNSSRWIEGPHAEPRNGLVGKISDPDAHTATWLSLEEFRQAVRLREEKYVPYPVASEYRALLAALESLERDGHETRVVFWFDN